ncbi:MAG: S9 family peptidase [Bacteroidales bacterium]|nr:S9 family peptidase [Bacteroidales bacterium]
MTRRIAEIVCILILTFGLYTMLKICTSKNDASKAIPASQIQLDGKMTPEALLALGRLGDPQVSPDGQRILYGVSYTDVKQNRSCRQLFLCNLDGSGKVQLTKDGASLSNARWISDRQIVFLQKGQVWTAKVRGGKLCSRRQLSDVEGGISEFSLSPDFSKILYISTVKGSVNTPADVYPDLAKAEAYTAEGLMHRHWDHWVTEIPHSYVADFSLNAKKGVTRASSTDLLGADCPFELPTEPFSGIEQLCWSPDGKYIAYSCRTKTGKDYAFSTNTDIYIYSLADGKTVQVTNGGGYDTDPIWSPDGSFIAWVSMARDGYEADQQTLKTARVWFNEDGVSVGSIENASGDFKYNVAGPCFAADGNIWFNALTEGLQAIYKAEYVVVDDDRCAGDDSPEEKPFWNIVRMTAEDDWHDYGTPFHVDGETVYATAQSMMRPAELAKVNLSDKSLEFITDENGHIFDQIEEPRMEARQIKTVDGKDMLTWVIYPPQFDPSKTYPGITICLGGPQGTISQSWSYRWCYRLMAEQGYVVVLPNRRGTTAFGQEWTEQISGDYAGLNIEDYKSAARALKAEPYVGKMAATGASYGGYSVYFLAGHNEDDLFDCFIAHAGIFNEEQMYYSTEEMWFPEFDNGGLGKGYLSGSPWSKEPKAQYHYAHSPHLFVQNWHTPILCIHGAMDFRIPYEQGMAAFNCAQMMGVPSKMVIFPDENHWILKPQNALYWHREYFAWLDQWCR